MKNYKKIKSVLLFLMVCIITSCSQNTVDKALDQYEAIVIKWEEKKQTGDLNLSNLTEIQQDFMKMDLNPETIQKNTEVTEAQKKRAQDLSARMGKLVMPF